VNIEKDAVHRKDSVQPFDELGLDEIVELALDSATRESASVEERHPLDITRKVISRKKLVASRDREIGVSAAMW